MRLQAILNFWFQELSPSDQFSKSDRIDSEIKRRFKPTLEQAAKGELFSWRATADGRLAEIIVLDQFSRNIFRDKAESFAQDALALALAQEMVRLELDRKIPVSQRSFVYMPYMHSESKLIHVQAVKLFDQPGFENNLKFEYLHKKIIDQFGRFPHRNEILDRKSTREELDFLKTPGSAL